MMLWDLNKMKPIKTVQPHTAGVWTMKFLSDGKRVVSGSEDASIAVFDISGKSKKPLSLVTEHKDKVFSVDVSADENLMVSSGTESEIIFWDFKKMSVLRKCKGNAWLTYNAKFVEGTNYVATGASNGQLRLYNTISFNVSAESKALRTWTRGMGFNWSNDKYKNKIYMGYEDGIIREWNYDKEMNRFKLGHDEWHHLDAVRDIQVLPEYDLLISSSRNGGTKIWNADTYDYYYLLTHHVESV